MSFLVLFVTALATALAVMPRLAATGQAAGLVDQPGTRKVHKNPIPRLGGVGVAIALALTLGVAVVIDGHDLATPGPDPRSLLPIISGAALVFAAGLWDDVSPVSAWWKLACELTAAVVVMGSGILIGHVTVFGTTYSLGAAAFPATALWIVVITNSFNLMDGLDGLAGGLVTIAAITCALVLIARGEQPAALLLVALAGAMTGFLAYNLHPARIFLGDSGSLLAGFLLAVTAVIGRQKGATTLAVGIPLLIFALPLGDTGASVLRRLRAGGEGTNRLSLSAAVTRVFAPDQAHLHHRLLGLGLSHRATVFVLYALSVLFSLAALASMERP